VTVTATNSAGNANETSTATPAVALVAPITSTPTSGTEMA
jgi:hypothetical protein